MRIKKHAPFNGSNQFAARCLRMMPDQVSLCLHTWCNKIDLKSFAPSPCLRRPKHSIPPSTYRAAQSSRDTAATTRYSCKDLWSSLEPGAAVLVISRVSRLSKARKKPRHIQLQQQTHKCAQCPLLAKTSLTGPLSQQSQATGV